MILNKSNLNFNFEVFLTTHDKRKFTFYVFFYIEKYALLRIVFKVLLDSF